MASGNEDEVTTDHSEVENFGKQDLEVGEKSELRQGRVWRWGTCTTQTDKQKSAGPVLRTTVKPVKRFRPDSSSDRSNPSPSRKKRIKCSTSATPVGKVDNEELLPVQNDGTSRIKTTNASVVFSSPNDETTESSNIDKVEKSSHDKERKVQTPGKQSQQDSVSAPVKKKRVWEQWSVEDKNYFFEAVAMYGKDFEAIRTAIAQKHRKKGEECLAKTKDQVRHLYYRTWGMISKIIDAEAYPLNINKAFQELYAVINYGEIRKRLGGNLKKKGIEKLNKLIRDGTTSTRVKGKNFRIKTPSCKALKKMYPEYQGKEGILDLPLVSDTRRMKIPLSVTLELFPLTMSAWNQVHSIAHNPRLRIKLSVECQLSSIFTYLEKKWKPLSTRLFRVAGQCQTAKNTPLHKLAKPRTPSSWDLPMVIQTPPDASVNTRIMVFQVTNNKTHCVVSYALRKSSQSLEKLAENTIENHKDVKKDDSISKEQQGNEEPHDALQNGAVSEYEIGESCLSSEDDFDYDSANEDALKDELAAPNHNVTCINSPTSPTDDFRVETLSTSFSLKERDCEGVFSNTSDIAEAVGASEDLVESGQESKKLEQNLATGECEVIADTRNKIEDGVLLDNNMDAISSELTTSDIGAAEKSSEQPISCSSVGENLKTISGTHEGETELEINDLNDVDHEDAKQEMDEEKSALTAANEAQPTVNGDSSSCNTDSSNDHCDMGEIPEQPICAVTSKPADGVCTVADISDKQTFSFEEPIELDKEIATEKTNVKGKKQKKLMLSNKLFRKADAKKQQRSAKKAKAFTKTTQAWTAKDCRKTTIAEIYMILGKPSVFRLCYNWIRTSTNESSDTHASNLSEHTEKKVAERSAEVSFSTGLLALVQAAKLTSLTKKQENTAKIENAVNKELPSSPVMSPAHTKPIKTKQAGVQCELLKTAKMSDKCMSNTTASNVVSSSNPHGRGMSKILPVETVLVDALPSITGFAIPTIPTSRHRKIAANPAKPIQGTKVSAETMNWLLQRERSRNVRQVRKPIVVDRTRKPKLTQAEYRTMKTFSIVTRGPNKVGFLPSKPILSSRPILAKPGSPVVTTSVSTASKTAAGVPESSGLTTLNIEEFLGIDTSQADARNITNTDSDINPGNLLAQAAKEAGVAPPTPSKAEKSVKETSPNDSAVEPSKLDCLDAGRKNPDFTPLSTFDTIENTTILNEAFGKAPHSTSPTKFASQLWSTGTDKPLVCPPATSSPPQLISSPALGSTSHNIEPLLEFSSWSGHDLGSSAFPIASESLVDKLVNGDKDVVLSSLTNPGNTAKSKVGTGNPRLISPSPKLITDENSNDSTSSKSISVNFDLHMTPVKSSELPVHPWTINTNSRDSIGLSGLLNTPQKVLPSDAEDSLDGFLMKKSPKKNGAVDDCTINLRYAPASTGTESKKSPTPSSKLRHPSQDQSSSSNFLAETDPEVELQLQCMLNENSVDYISKFQDLVRQTTDFEELPVMASDENARDGHVSTPNPLCSLDPSVKEAKENG